MFLASSFRTEVSGDHFGVHSHPAHISRLLRSINWSLQKPITKATQRDEEAIRRWSEERWPMLRKKADAEGRTIVWVDEAGFSLLPAAVRTSAPRGKTPILRVPWTRDHLVAISALTVDLRLLLLMQEQPLDSDDVVRFFRHLLRHIPGPLLVIWDGSPIHRSHVVKAFLASAEGQRIQLEPLPGYAPELNPDEGIWRYLKHVELRNVCCPSLSALRDVVRLAVKRLRHKVRVLAGCIQYAGYQV
ncbi:MAG: IS630 family transposase [Chloroflexi bacterium]|nr:IS630 family transposase [Chloroflexota bacterium]